MTRPSRAPALRRQEQQHHPLSPPPPTPNLELAICDSPAPSTVVSISPSSPPRAPPIPAHRGKLPDIAPKLPI
ncbi:hypothetical protein V492_04883 [Pseudogymnoascus sp. VKM F-4246]|nr:hypothetical protein V492_04883 [Pseudogymnoascus sp. VKM F-4246]